MATFRGPSGAVVQRQISFRRWTLRPLTYFAVFLAGVGYAEESLDETTRGVQVYSQWISYSKENGLPGNDVRAVRVFKDQVWVGTTAGLARLKDGEWKSWTVRDGLPVPMVTAIDVDPQTEEVWAGTWGGGLVRFSAGRLDVFNQYDSGLAGNLVTAVLFHDGHVWAATNGGISAYDRHTDTWALYEARRADAPPMAIAQLGTFDNRIFAISWQGGLNAFNADAQRWLPVEAPLNSASNDAIKSIMAMASDDSSLWGINRDSIVRFNALGDWSASQIQVWSYSGRYDAFLVSGGRGELAWVTGSGVNVMANWNDKSWVCYGSSRSHKHGVVRRSRDEGPIDVRSIPSSFPDGWVQSVAFGDQEIWVGTANGLGRGRSLMAWGMLPSLKPRCGGQFGPEFYGPLLWWEGKSTAEWNENSKASIGVYGPRTQTIALPGKTASGSAPPSADLRAIQAVVEMANRKPDRDAGPDYTLSYPPLGYGNYGWGLPEDDLAWLGYQENVVGIVGFLGPDNWLTDMIAYQTRVPVVNMSSFEHREQANRWVFECLGDEPRRQRQLLDYLFNQEHKIRLAILVAEGIEFKRHQEWWMEHAGRSRHAPVQVLSTDLTVGDSDARFERLEQSNPDVILAACDAPTAAKLLKRLRSRGMDQLFVGEEEIVTDAFIKQAGPNAGEVAALAPASPSPPTKKLEEFASAYASQNLVRGRPQPPKETAYRSLYATDHLMAAIELAGADRESVRHALEIMGQSVYGERHYERLHAAGPMKIAKLQDGKWVISTVPSTQTRPNAPTDR